jgi:putative transposase
VIKLLRGPTHRVCANNVRLNSATGYITPKDMLAGRQQEINAQRDRKLEAARKQRQIRRKQAA